MKILESAPVKVFLGPTEGLSTAALGHTAGVFGLVLIAGKHFIQSERFLFCWFIVDVASAFVIPFLVLSFVGLPFGVVGDLFDWLHELPQSQSVVGGVVLRAWLTVVGVIVVGVGEVGVVVVVGLTL